MPNPEVVQSAGNIVHHFLEARAALTDPNFLHMLRDIGHPYGLMLSSLSQNKISSTPSSHDSNAGVRGWIELIPSCFQSSSQNLQTSADALGPYFSGESYNFSSSRLITEISLLVSSFGLSEEYSGSSPLSCLNQESSAKSSASSSVLPVVSYEASSKNSKEDNGEKVVINKNNLSFGTVSLNLAKYKGQEPFIVKSPQGEPLTEIQPGSPLAFLHLNRQAAEMRQLTPLERIQIMTQDLKKVFSLIDNPTTLDGLKPEQQAVLTAAKSAVIVGISHLVPIFHRITNFPTWKLDVLPKAVQEFHRFDSQAVSNKFGGHRQVKVEDIEMTVITPQMRQVLVATTI